MYVYRFTCLPLSTAFRLLRQSRSRGYVFLKKITIRALAVMLALAALSTLFAPAVFATGTLTAYAASFKMETDSSSVRAKDIIMLTVTLTNDSTKDINKLEFSLKYDETRILGITPDYTTSINGVSKPNEESPVVLRQQGSTIKVYNYNPTDSTIQPTPLKSGQKLILEFPLVVSEAAATGEISFTISDAVMTDSSGGSLTAEICQPAKVTILPVASDATLSNLEVTVNNAPVTLTPAFSPNVTEYTVTVGYSIPSFGISATCNDSRASYSITERPANDMLAVGSNTYKYLVTAEDGVTTKTYTLTIRRLAAGETTTTTASTASTTESTETTTTTTTASMTTLSTTVSTTTTSALPTSISASDSAASTVKEGSTVTLNMASLLGIVAAAVALFLLAFTAGYITHKNASQPQKYSVDELMAAQERLELQNRLSTQTADTSYQPVYTSPVSSYQPTYTQPISAPAASYQGDAYSGYQPDMTGVYGGQNLYTADEFTPQAEYVPQPVDSMENMGGYGLGTIDYSQPMDGAPSDFAPGDQYYYQ